MSSLISQSFSQTRDTSENTSFFVSLTLTLRVDLEENFFHRFHGKWISVLLEDNDFEPNIFSSIGGHQPKITGVVVVPSDGEKKRMFRISQLVRIEAESNFSPFVRS
jgi:hypothetical protein